MAAIMPKTSNIASHVKPKPKITSKKGALSIINGDINTRKRSNDSRKVNCKSQKQQNLENSHTLGAQKFPVFVHQDVDVMKLKENCLLHEQENEEASHLISNENCLPASLNDVLSVGEIRPVNDVLPVKSSSFSIECDELLPEIKKEPVILNNEKKNKRLYSDFVWCTPYRHDIYTYFKSAEKKFRPNSNYMAKQSDITMSMRSVLIDWFVEVGEEYKLQAETLYLAVSYLDRFLSHMSVLRGKLQLVGTASMFLAAKYEEIYPPELSDFVYITDDTYTKKQILRMEHLILKVLNFNVSTPTAYTFLCVYCSMCNASETVIHLSQYICELSLLEGNPFMKFLPSIIAAGSLALANYTLGHDMWDEDLVTSTGYQLSDLMYVILCLYNKYSVTSSCPQQSIREKYKSSKYSCVSSIEQPKSLTFPEKSSKRFCYI